MYLPYTSKLVTSVSEPAISNLNPTPIGWYPYHIVARPGGIHLIEVMYI